MFEKVQKLQGDQSGFGQNWYSAPSWATRTGGNHKSVEVVTAIRRYGRGNSMTVYSVLLGDGRYMRLTGTDGTWRACAGHITEEE